MAEKNVDLESLIKDVAKSESALVKAADAVQSLGARLSATTRNVVDMAAGLTSTTKAAQALPAYYAQISASARVTESTFRSMTVTYGDFVAVNQNAQAALGASAQSHAAIGQAAQFSSGELAKLGGALTGVLLSVAAGEGAIEALIGGLSSIVEVVGAAAISAGSLHAGLAGLTAQALPLLATFAPWIAGLAAVGAAVYFLNKRHEEHKKRIEDLNKSVGDMEGKLAQAYPSLNALTNQTDLASQGSANFAAWLRKKSQGMADYGKNVRAATLDLLNQQVVEAKTNADRLRAENIGVNSRGAKVYIGPGDGLFGLFGGVNSKAYKKYVADQARADAVLAHAQAVYGEAKKAKVEAFTGQAESAQKATAAVKAYAEAIQASAVEVVSLADGVISYRIGLAEEIVTMGRSEEQKRRDTAARMISLAVTQEEADEIRRLEQARRDQNQVMKEGEEVQKAIKAQQDETIKTINDTVGSTIRLSSKMEILASDFENAVKQAADMRSAVEGIGAAIKNNDWTGAFANLFNVLERVKKAFQENKSSSDKFAAISGLGQGIGSIVGGRAGASISGAASGMQAGSMLASTLGMAGPWGAAIGAALGGLSGLLGTSNAKAQAKIDALMKAQQDQQAKQKESSGAIEKSLGLASEYQNSDLDYSNAMLASLRSIDNHIGAVVNSIALSIKQDGLLDTSGLGLGTVKAGPSTLTKLLSPLAMILPGLFGSKTKTELLDQGLVFRPTTFGALGNGGFAGQTYADLVSTKTSKFLGFNTGTKVTTSTAYGAIAGDLLGQITDAIQELGKGVVVAATTFGPEAGKAAQDALAGVSINLGKLSLKDLKPDEIEAAINALFNNVADDLAAAGLPGLQALAKAGEGAFETLTRLATEYKTIDAVLASVGMDFKSSGVGSLEARKGLLDKFGGLDAFASQTAFFGEHFLTDEDRMKPLKASVTSGLAAIGQPADLSREGFKTLVQSQNLSMVEGAELYKTLMDLAPAFDKVATAAENVREKQTSIQDQIDELVMSPTELLNKSRAKEQKAVEDLDASLVPLLKNLWDLQDAAEAAKLATDKSNMLADLAEAQGQTEVAKRMRRDLALAQAKDPEMKGIQQQVWAAQDAAEKVSAARDVLTQAYEKERDALELTKDKFKELSESLRAFSASLTDTIAGTDPGARYRRTRETFLSTAAMARLGDPDAMGRLQNEGEAFTAASRDYVSTSLDYLRDVGLVRNAVDEAADTADRQVSIAQRQLDALDASVQGLIQINASVVSVEQAILNLQAANQAAAAAGVVSVGGQPVPAAQANTPSTPPLTDAQKDLNNAAFWWGLTNTDMGRATANDPSDINKYAQGMAAKYTPGYMDIVNSQGIAAANALVDAGKLTYTQGGSLKFATGGSFEVGGSGPPDSKLFNLALTPGEAVNVQRADQKGDRALINELRRLREELADLRQTSVRIANSNDKMERTLTNVTEGGRAMQTQATA